MYKCDDCGYTFDEPLKCGSDDIKEDGMNGNG